MSAQTLEFTLARLYTDPVFRDNFLSDPLKMLKDCELTESERLGLMKIDRAGLVMASRSFFHKRKKRFLSRSVFKKLAFKLKTFAANLLGRFS